MSAVISITSDFSSIFLVSERFAPSVTPRESLDQRIVIIWNDTFRQLGNRENETLLLREQKSRATAINALSTCTYGRVVRCNTPCCAVNETAPRWRRRPLLYSRFRCQLKAGGVQWDQMSGRSVETLSG